MSIYNEYEHNRMIARVLAKHRECNRVEHMEMQTEADDEARIVVATRSNYPSTHIAVDKYTMRVCK